MKQSTYQAAILAALRDDTRDILVSAKAGSGKTTTLRMIADELPADVRQRSMFLAFNKSIAAELQRKLPQGMSAGTIHSMGLRALRPLMDRGTKIEGSKYRWLVQLYLDECESQALASADKKDRADFESDLENLVRLSMLNLVPEDDCAAMQAIAARFDLAALEPFWDIACAAVRDVRRWGVTGAPHKGRHDFSLRGMVGFDDMVAQPVLLDLAVPTFDILMVDECQDLNAALRRFCIKMKGARGRAIWVGDPNQAIYGFAGADAESFDRIRQETGALELPLNECYRCPTSHLALAQEIVPDIQPAPGAAVGEIDHIKHEHLVEKVKDGDVLLCRTNAPLLEACYQMIAAGKPATVVGRDIGKSLTRVLSDVEASRKYNGEFSNFIDALAEYECRKVALLKKRDGTEMQIASLEDRCECIRTIFRAEVARGGANTMEELAAAIDRIFDDSRATIRLSSIHKFKGGEAERVFILRPEMMPHPMAKQAWQITQEHNLRYVAMTRSTRYMAMVPAPDQA